MQHAHARSLPLPPLPPLPLPLPQLLARQVLQCHTHTETGGGEGEREKVGRRRRRRRGPATAMSCRLTFDADAVLVAVPVPAPPPRKRKHEGQGHAERPHAGRETRTMADPLPTSHFPLQLSLSQHTTNNNAFHGSQLLLMVGGSHSPSFPALRSCAVTMATTAAAPAPPEPTPDFVIAFVAQVEQEARANRTRRVSLHAVVVDDAAPMKAPRH